MYESETQIRVRYGETDKMGVVYYGNYSLYYEEARTDAIRQLGVPYSQLEEMGIMMPVARMTIKYVLPALYDQLLRVKTIITEMPGRAITFRMEIFNEEDYLINIGETVLLFIDSKTRKAKRAPEILLEKLRPLLRHSMKQLFEKFLGQPKVKKAIEKGKKLALPGFDGIPFYDIMRFFIKETRENTLVNRAKAIAFSFFLAIFPAVIFLFTLIPYIPIENMQRDLLELIQSVMPSEAAFSIIENTVRDIVEKPRGGLLSTGFILTIYFSSNGVLALLQSFDKSYSIYNQRNFFENLVVSFYMTFLLTGLMIFSVFLIVLGEDLLNLALEFLQLRSSLVSLALNMLRYLVIILLFLFGISMIYYFGPAAKEKWRFFSTGSTFATISSILISAGFSYYVQNFARYNEFYGSLGTIAMLLIYLYLNSYVLLIGFELNASIYYHKNFHKLKKADEDSEELIAAEVNVGNPEGN